jgi:hypothetical protein
MYDTRRPIRQSWFDSQLQLSAALVLDPHLNAVNLWSWYFTISDAQGVIPTYRLLYKHEGPAPVTSVDEAEEAAMRLWRTMRHQIAEERDRQEAEVSPPECGLVLRQGGQYWAVALPETPREALEAVRMWRHTPQADQTPYVQPHRDFYSAVPAVAAVLTALTKDHGKEF